jgi:uncharacterized protein YneF (UPF0154 family)
MENGKWKMVNGKRERGRITLFALVFTFSIFHFPFSMNADSALASPTQEDVFKSIQNSENESVDGGKVLAVLAIAVGLVIVLTLFSRRQKREAVPKALNHQGKLMREMMKTAGLKSSEVRQLKALADEIAAAGEPLESPLTLMLCPSLIRKSGQQAASSGQNG